MVNMSAPKRVPKRSLQTPIFTDNEMWVLYNIHWNKGLFGAPMTPSLYLHILANSVPTTTKQLQNFTQERKRLYAHEKPDTW